MMSIGLTLSSFLRSGMWINIASMLLFTASILSNFLITAFNLYGYAVPEDVMYASSFPVGGRIAMELLMPWFNYGRIFHSINAKTLVNSTSFYTLEQASALHRVTSNGGVAFDAPSDRPLCKNPWTIVFLVSYRVSSPPFFLCFCLLNVLSTF